MNPIHHLRRSIVVAAVATTVVVGVAGPAQAGIGPKATPLTVPAAPATVAHAPNPAGALITAVTKPTAPRSPTAKPRNTAVRLTWLAPSSNGGATVNRYRVQRATGKTGPWKTIAKPTLRRYRAAGLTNGKRYYFRIAAHNAAGWSTPSKVVNALPRTVPNRPTPPTVTPGDGSVTLNWQKPAGNGAAVDYYQVQRAVSPASWTTFPAQKPAEFIDFNVINGGSYFYRVRAHNAAGYGPFSPVVIGVPRTVPSAPASCSAEGFEVTKKWVSFGWDAPASDGGAPVTGYVIQVFKNGFYQGTPGGSPTPPYHGVFEVQSSGNYDVDIYAVNKAGWGPACHATTSVPVP